MTTENSSGANFGAEAILNGMSKPQMVARLTPAGFASVVSDGKWKLAPHLSILNRKLVALAYGRTTRLIVELPPRHGKSELISKYLPVWYLGNFPDNRVILTSYSDTFAETWGRKARDILETYGNDIFNVRVSQTSGAANRWDIEGHDGGMSTAGAGGSLTGKGAHLLDIDDPYKSDKEANSRRFRDNIWEWYKSTARTRVEPGGSIVLVQTRWHNEDLAGMLITKMEQDKKKYEEDLHRVERGEIRMEEVIPYEKWDILKFPAIAEEDEYYEKDGQSILFRRKGEPLWAERYDTKDLIVIRDTIGSYWWSALYQQSPAPQGGGVFKDDWFRYYRKSRDGLYYETIDPESSIKVEKRVEIKKCRTLMFIDTAGTTTTRSDYTVFMTVAVAPSGEIFVTDIFRERIETSEHGKELRNSFYKNQPLSIYVENKTFGMNMIQSLKHETGLPIRPMTQKANVDKLTRSYAASAKMETGMIFFNAEMKNLDKLERELIDFPTGEHDDMVDCLCYCVLELQARNQPQIRRL